LSSEKFEEVKRIFGFDPRSLIGKKIGNYEIDQYIAHGSMGVLFHAIRKDVGDEAACKIIPQKRLQLGWENELVKLVKLTDIPQVVQYKAHDAVFVENVPQACILYQFIHGMNLREYERDCPQLITLEFVEMLLKELLEVLQALKETNVAHGDLHEGNIMVANPDPRFIVQKPRIKVTDFGIGTSNLSKAPRDDYQDVAMVCSTLLRKYVDPAKLEGEDRYFRSRLLTDFLEKQLVETNITIGDFVRNPVKLMENLNEIRAQYKRIEATGTRSKLEKPFDYLSCEHFGDSFELLQKLYSRNFPGYQELDRRINTILTGPRGCGKTTVFKNLSLKTQLLGKEHTLPEDFIGIYYHCSDLSFAFPYTIEKLGDSEQKTITHYFNLALLCEILDTLVIADEHDLRVQQEALDRLQGFIQGWLMTYRNPPVGTSVLRHLLSLMVAVKEEFRDNVDKCGMDTEKWPAEICSMSLLPQDFIMRLCRLLRDCIPWVKETPFYFFLDDYSLPKVSREVQFTLHNFILNRYSELFFKISTESIISFLPQDAKGKLFEEGREYEVIDLGDYFLHASGETKQEFMAEVVNNRLKNAEEFEWECRSIQDLMGDASYKTYVELAEAIKSGKTVRYSGWKTIVDLCSGDIANILRLIRNIFSLSALRGMPELPISDEIQDQSIRETSGEFLEKLKAIPDTGPQIVRIVQAFGEVANHYLKTRRSKNVRTNPPYQAFRIELLETPRLEVGPPDKELVKEPLGMAPQKLYNDLVKYGVFIRDVKGKSQRGSVVPRLYLRRLLIPTFLLTPNKRDHIRVDAKEFKMLLTEPEKFKIHMIGKPYRETESEVKQRRLGR
jgi:serine/threonine protein kinase